MPIVGGTLTRYFGLRFLSSVLLVFLGIETADSRDDIVWLAGKMARLRVFSDENGAMNLSVQNIAGDLLIVSQFTLLASTRKGNRPSFVGAAAPGQAN